MRTFTTRLLAAALVLALGGAAVTSPAVAAGPGTAPAPTVTITGGFEWTT